MASEQQEYRRRLGTNTSWHDRASPVYIHRNCVAAPELLLLKRGRACVGWAVHGLIMEHIDGSTRSGHEHRRTDIDDDHAIERRQGTDWVDIAPGDYVRRVRGYNLSVENFLCHTLTLELASGSEITFASRHEPWKGEAFEYQLPEPTLLQHISFRDGRCIGLTAVESYLHLPVDSVIRVPHKLPRPHRDRLELLMLCAQRVDDQRRRAGRPPLGRDVWMKILGEFLANRDLESHESSALGQLKQLKMVGEGPRT